MLHYNYTAGAKQQFHSKHLSNDLHDTPFHKGQDYLRIHRFIVYIMAFEMGALIVLGKLRMPDGRWIEIF